MWKYRERLSYNDKLKRSLYKIMRDSLESHLMKISLIDSFYNFMKHGIDYTFVDKSELKPRSKKMEKESELYNTFIVIFAEGVVRAGLKSYLRFFPENAVTKKNLEPLYDFTLYKKFHQNLRHFDNPRFFDMVKSLLKIDYALLIQQDPTVKKKNRYSLTHFHVKVDWPIADAAQDLAKSLRYIHSNLYELGDKEGRTLQNKLFEYYGCHHSVGGRRTAGLIAAQLFKKMDFLSTVFVSSSESRAMYKYSERGVSKFFLIKLTKKQVNALAQRQEMDVKTFSSYYLYPANGFHIGLSEAFYRHTEHSMPPEDGKIRELQPAYNWLKLGEEVLHPRISAHDSSPINYAWVYSDL